MLTNTVTAAALSRYPVLATRTAPEEFSDCTSLADLARRLSDRNCSGYVRDLQDYRATFDPGPFAEQYSAGNPYPVPGAIATYGETPTKLRTGVLNYRLAFFGGEFPESYGNSAASAVLSWDADSVLLVSGYCSRFPHVVSRAEYDAAARDNRPYVETETGFTYNDLYDLANRVRFANRENPEYADVKHLL